MSVSLSWTVPHGRPEAGPWATCAVLVTPPRRRSRISPRGRLRSTPGMALGGGRQRRRVDERHGRWRPTLRAENPGQPSLRPPEDADTAIVDRSRAGDQCVPGSPVAADESLPRCQIIRNCVSACPSMWRLRPWSGTARPRTISRRRKTNRRNPRSSHMGNPNWVAQSIVRPTSMSQNRSTEAVNATATFNVNTTRLSREGWMCWLLAWSAPARRARTERQSGASGRPPCRCCDDVATAVTRRLLNRPHAYRAARDAVCVQGRRRHPRRTTLWDYDKLYDPKSGRGPGQVARGRAPDARQWEATADQPRRPDPAARMPTEHDGSLSIPRQHCLAPP